MTLRARPGSALARRLGRLAVPRPDRWTLRPAVPGSSRWVRRLGLAVAVVVLLAGCSVGRDAVAVGGDFQFVAPNGQTEIYYEPPAERGMVRGISGESLTKPGTTVDLDGYRGQVVVLNIWGSWCGPCKKEMPDLQFVQDQARAAGVTVLGIDFHDEPVAARDFLRDRGITFDSIFDPAGRTLLALRGYPRNAVPSTIVLDREHRAAAVFLGTVRVGQLLPLVQRLATDPT